VKFEFTPITDALLSKKSLISSKYLYAVESVDSKANANILADNIDKACNHDEYILSMLCAGGRDEYCTRAAFLISDCEMKSNDLSMKIMKLEDEEIRKTLSDEPLTDGQPSSGQPSPPSSYPTFAPPPITAFPLTGAPSFSAAGVSSRPACQTQCTSTWISCDKGCEVAPNYGNDPGFYDRQSSCHALCRQSYSMCQTGC
jgi:hypothetical protein